MMNEGVTIPHPPALKVGGRRLSVSAKRRNSASEGSNPEPNPREEDIKADYPRPAPPSGTEVLRQEKDEDVPKKEEKHGFVPETQLFEQAYWKGTTPTRDLHGNMRGPTMGMRIRQPGGKALGI